MRARRVLHVIRGLDRGGVETWLMNLLRRTDRKEIDMHFLVQTTKVCAFDEEARDRGSQLLVCEGWPSRPLLFAQTFHTILRESGPFDVIHSHTYLASGLLVRLAASVQIPIRIAHSHSAVPEEKQASLPRSFYSRWMRHWIWTYATLGLGCSSLASDKLFGPRWRHDPRFSLLPYGIQLERFAQPPDTHDLRASLQIPDDRLILGHVGRFVDVKNHAFLLRLLAYLHRKPSKYHLLLVGHGPLFASIQEEIGRLNLAPFVSMVGLQADIVPYLALMDLFVMPSFYEGLPVSLIETQAIGLPALISSTISTEVDVIPSLIRRISLQDPLSSWEAAIQHLLASPLPSRDLGYQAMLQSPMNILSCLARLRSLYQVPTAKSPLSS